MDIEAGSRHQRDKRRNVDTWHAGEACEGRLNFAQACVRQSPSECVYYNPHNKSSNTAD